MKKRQLKVRKVLSTIGGTIGFIGFIIMVGSAGNSDLNIGTFWGNTFLAILGLLMMLGGCVIADVWGIFEAKSEEYQHRRRMRERREFQSKTRMDWECGMSYPDNICDSDKLEQLACEYVDREIGKFVKQQQIRQKVVGGMAYNSIYSCYMVLVDYSHQYDWKFCFCDENGRPTSPVNRCSVDIDTFDWVK